MHRAAALSLLALVAAPSLVSAQETPQATTTPAGDRQPAAASPPRDEPGQADRINTQPGGSARAARAEAAKLSDAEIAGAPIRERRVETQHAGVFSGRSIAYTATAGTVTVRDDDGKPTASMFYVAYTAGSNGGRSATRPVTFLYNGGPGSSSLWLHMGSLAPVRVATDSPASTANAPFHLLPNGDSLLDKTDLVFIDAMGAGYSRPLGDTKLQAFWGTDPDIDVFARAIERWLTINDRWNSAKFIFGESYGTTRSAGLAYRLAQDGAQLNGVVLLSSILNYGRRSPGFDQELINYLPTYAAIAAYHHRLPGQSGEVMPLVQQVRDWARGPYALALAQGQSLPDDQRQAIATQMAGYTGLSARFILDNDLRVEPAAFRKELLRDQRRTLGRYDARFTGIDAGAGGDAPSYDPSDTGITGAFVSSFHHYLTHDLRYDTDLVYRPTYYTQSLRWSFDHHPPGSRGAGATNQADVALDLSAAMRQNPNLKVFSLNGLYDMATPFFGTEYDLGHMQLDRSLQPNLRFAYYPSGHMVYLNVDSLHAMHGDLAQLYDEAARGAGDDVGASTGRSRRSR